MAKVLNGDNVRELVRREAAKVGGIPVWCKQNNISDSFLYEVLRRHPGVRRMIDQSEDIGLDLETARGLIDAVRERLQAALDDGADDEAARRLLDRLERLSGDVARVGGVVAGQGAQTAR